MENQHMNKHHRNNRAEQKRKKAKPFALSPRLQAILPHWRSLDSLPPKLTAVVDTCSLSEVYARLEKGEYDAVKDGAALKISTASILKRRENLPRAEFRAIA
jgi:hypothetical protein